MIISDMRHLSLFQNAVIHEQGRVSDPTVGVPKSRPETAQGNRNISSSSASATEASRGNSLGKLITRVDLLKESLEKILTHFPPFFPIGTYQRPDWILEIKGMQDEIAQLAAANKELPPFTMPAGELNETSSDGEIMEAMQGMLQFSAEASASMKKQAEATPLSIKI